MMRNAALAAALLPLLLANSASAQCEFDAPAKAKGLKTSLVRAYATCGGITFPAPNTLTNAGVPACAPVQALSEFQFGPKGSCRFRISTRFKDPCPDSLDSPCQEMKIRADCKDIVEPDGHPIESGEGWYLGLALRATVTGRSDVDMTAIDWPWKIHFPGWSRGKLKMKLTLETCPGAVCTMFPPANQFPPCTSLEILNASIIDPTGAAFATMGSSSR